MTFSDLERRDAKGQTFPGDHRNYVPTVWSWTAINMRR